MRDPYLFDDVDILRNLGNIRDNKVLKQAEGDVTRHTIPLVYAHQFTKFNTDTLKEIHRIIFDSLYDWAGEYRTIQIIIKREEVLGGDTVRYTYPDKINEELNEASHEIRRVSRLIVNISCRAERVIIKRSGKSAILSTAVTAFAIRSSPATGWRRRRGVS